MSSVPVCQIKRGVAYAAVSQNIRGVVSVVVSPSERGLVSHCSLSPNHTEQRVIIPCVESITYFGVYIYFSGCNKAALSVILTGVLCVVLHAV